MSDFDEAFYDSDEGIAWGPLTLREIKNDLKSTPKIIKRRHSDIGITTSAENKSNSSGASAYFTPNETFQPESASQQNELFLEKLSKVIEGENSSYTTALQDTHTLNQRCDGLAQILKSEENTYIDDVQLSCLVENTCLPPDENDKANMNLSSTSIIEISDDDNSSDDIIILDSSLDDSMSHKLDVKNIVKDERLSKVCQEVNQNSSQLKDNNSVTDTNKADELQEQPMLLNEEDANSENENSEHLEISEIPSKDSFISLYGIDGEETEKQILNLEDGENNRCSSAKSDSGDNESTEDLDTEDNPRMDSKSNSIVFNDTVEEIDHFLKHGFQSCLTEYEKFKAENLYEASQGTSNGEHHESTEDLDTENNPGLEGLDSKNNSIGFNDNIEERDQLLKQPCLTEAPQCTLDISGISNLSDGSYGNLSSIQITDNNLESSSESNLLTFSNNSDYKSSTSGYGGSNKGSSNINNKQNYQTKLNVKKPFTSKKFDYVYSPVGEYIKKKSPCNDKFKLPLKPPKPKVTPRTPVAHLNQLKNIKSPVGMYIKNSPGGILKKNIPAKTVSKLMIPSSHTDSDLKNKENFSSEIPPVIYKPAKKVVCTIEKHQLLPSSIEHMIPERMVTKHEERKKEYEMNTSLIRNKLLEEDISVKADASLLNEPNDISYVTIKKAFIE